MQSKGKVGDRPPSPRRASVPDAETSIASPGNISYHNHTEERAATLLMGIWKLEFKSFS